MSEWVRAVLLPAGSLRPIWVDIRANVTGPELSALIGSSQPECLTVSTRLVAWCDGSSVPSDPCHLVHFSKPEQLAMVMEGAVLIVGSRDPRDTSDESDPHACYSTPSHAAPEAIPATDVVVATRDSADESEPSGCYFTPSRAALEAVFNADFVSALYD